MRIILTHEQTDFDGIASLLGANLIDENAIPVLPRRINRNVRGFLTLYGAELPFIDPRDMPAKPIEMITLVDTQSLVSVKGMGDETHIKVVDHHNPRPNLPPEWEFISDQTGANTTIFVEAIQERCQHLNMVQATLLLLGIYEDTGSLTYSRTTPRDVRAAAYLLDEGANLSIANDFLNHPLSLEQQAIYRNLQANAESLDVHGLAVLLATSDAQESEEELSTIAHKLRDLLDPEALILVIQTRGGIQLICRSTSDNIDVAQIAAHFGGGGHPRAAAGLIKNRTLEEVYAELKAILPQHVQPPVTVAEIMSRAPQVLPPETPVEEASRRMQRYGYEGYPVVENNTIVGLLTRRAVDRALSHKLNLPASSLMKAGDTHVHPDHSIEYLQNIMTDTDWGQIPVVERDSHQIIGIVTRTDLLKILTTKPTRAVPRNLSEKLTQALPSVRLDLLHTIAEMAKNQNAALFIVGGFVRDLLLNRPSLDFDLVVEGDAIELAQALGKQFGGRVTMHKRFGTAKWLLEESTLQQGNLPASLDFISARTEFYTHPTALPTVERGSIKLDLHRRDFTINTLALRLDGHHYGELHDYWGGLKDLQDEKIRVLHSLSFVDDPTRILRAVRYEKRYNFAISERSYQLLLEARSLMNRISGDRIRHELDNILDEENAIQMLDRLNELDVLSEIHKDLKWEPEIAKQIATLEEHTPDPIWNLSPDMEGARLKRALAYILWLIPIPIYRIQGVIKRLKLPAALTGTIRAACFIWHDLPNLADQKPSEITRRCAKTPPLAIYGLYRATNDEKVHQCLFQFAQKWREIKPVTTGHDLKEMGLAPGPIYAQILEDLRSAWLDEEITCAEEEFRLRDHLIAAQKSFGLSP